jgi:hypothetical protein
MSGISVGVKSFDQSAQTWSEDDEVAGADCSGVGVSGACGDKYCCSWAGGLGSAGIAKGEFTFEDVPCLVVFVMDVKGRGTTAAPFVDFE